jgi:DNA-binding NarL/FixJ family response regulator
MREADDELAAARAAATAGDWPRACDAFRAAREAGQPLTPDDEMAYGDAAWWLGDNETTLAATERAWDGFLAAGRTEDAAMAAFGMAGVLFLRGDVAPGGGWVQRAQRLLADLPEGAPHGYLAYALEVESQIGTADPQVLAEASRRVQAIGERVHDRTLVASGLLGEGRAMLQAGEVAAGLALLDEAMLIVADGEVRPDFAGNLYCHMMSACHELGDVRRARAWTEATGRWLDALPAAVVFTGVCRVHRSQLQLLGGAWDQAEAEAARVTRDLADLNMATAAEAHYQVGELRRLRGDYAGAESAYRRAHERGRDPQPGLALLRLAQGRADAAAASIRVALAGATQPLARAPLLAAEARIAAGCADSGLATSAAAELRAIADRYHSDGLLAAAAHAEAIAELAAGRPDAAIPPFRDALRRWLELNAPYEAACVRRGIAEAAAALGDTETAALERDAARVVFESLSALPDLEALRDDGSRVTPAAAGGLTARELEVLRAVAAGRTNREVADALVLSEKTVARHLANIYVKLDVASRTEAAAFAYQNGLIGPPH